MNDYDWIRGFVLEAIDGNTFSLKVNFADEDQNRYQYNEIERIRITDLKAPPLQSYDGIMARHRLNARLKYKNIHCLVKYRDTENYLVCEVLAI